ncbi:MAG: NAD(P)(+) transhydrogenase (Re/Si-specific) subunit beta [Rickettsiales endosymbiont of Dermacentor nuttalli]
MYSINIAYLITIVCFIFSLQSMSSLASYKRGVIFNILAIIISLITIIYNVDVSNVYVVFIALAIGSVIGLIISAKVNMYQMPIINNILHMFIGASELLIAYSIYYYPGIYGIGNVTCLHLVLMGLTIILSSFEWVGALCMLVILRNIGFNRVRDLNHKALWNILLLVVLILLMCLLCYFGNSIYLNLLFLCASLFIALIILSNVYIEIPIITALVNSCSGWGLICIGMILENILLITIGALVGVSGMVITSMISKYSNYRLSNMLLAKKNTNTIRSHLVSNMINAEDAAFILKNVKSVIIVPGYGMAGAEAQNTLRGLTLRLLECKIQVKFAVHRLAGHMPAHMNILLTEAGIGYEQIYEYEDIHREFSVTDVVLVVGANDIINPKLCNIGYSLPLNGIEKAKSVIIINRDLDVGYSGITNELFTYNNVMTICGDAKEVISNIIDFLSPQGVNVVRKLIF